MSAMLLAVVVHAAGARRAREEGGSRVEHEPEGDDEQGEADDGLVQVGGDGQAGEGGDQREGDADDAAETTPAYPGCE
jgi:hypothetical protein